MESKDVKEILNAAEKSVEQSNKLLENTKFTREILGDYKKDIKRINIICLSLVFAIVVAFVTFFIFYNNQQKEYINTIEKQQDKYLKIISEQQKDFIDFLNQYDFETESVQQDGDGYNYYNRDNEVSGDLNNGAENTLEDAEEEG